MWVAKSLIQKKNFKLFFKEIVFNVLFVKFHDISFIVIVTDLLNYNDPLKNIFLVKHFFMMHLKLYASGQTLPNSTRYV